MAQESMWISRMEDKVLDCWTGEGTKGELRLQCICLIATRLTAVQVILICGLSVPSIIWHHVGQILAKNGLCALIYSLCYPPFTCSLKVPEDFVDLYGRGYSDAPQTEYNRTLYITQVALLLQAIKWDKVSVVGLSMVGP